MGYLKFCSYTASSLHRASIKRHLDNFLINFNSDNLVNVTSYNYRILGSTSKCYENIYYLALSNKTKCSGSGSTNLLIEWYKFIAHRAARDECENLPRFMNSH